MSKNLMIFENKQVEVFHWNGQVLFNPYHVGKCLELKDSAVRMAISKMNEKQVIKLTNSNVKEIDFRKLHNTGENFLTERGVYKLIFKSKKKEAEKFQDWVTDEVLPTIRKHGAYMTEEILEKTIQDPDFIIGLATELKKEKELINIQKGIIVKQQPKVTIADRFLNSNGCMEINTLAKILDIPNFGRTKLFHWLRNKHILMYNNLPYQRFQDYFKVTQVFCRDGHYRDKTLIKPKGILYIIKKLIKDNKVATDDYDKLIIAVQEEMKSKVA